jgi:hypothetical protein
MNDDYIKKLEEENKRLEETLGKYIDRYGEIKPYQKPDVIVGPIEDTFGSLVGGVITAGPIYGVSSNGITSMNNNITTFSATSPNGNSISVSDGGITIKSNNINIDCESITSSKESETSKQLKVIKSMLEQIARMKPKPIFKRYCRVTFKRLKRKIGINFTKDKK